MSSVFLMLKTVVFPEFVATIHMTILTSIFTSILSVGLGMILYVTSPAGLKPCKCIYKILSFIINVIRSFPILIFIIALLPVTRFIFGTAIGAGAACFPLTLAATAFVSRLLEENFREVDHNLIEVAKAIGMNTRQIVTRVVFKETVPVMVQSITLGVISILSATTVAGVVGAGGLGAIAISYGYQSFNGTVLISTVCFIVILIQIIQILGDWVYKLLR